MVIEVMDSNFATKTDFNELKSDFQILRSEMTSLKAEMNSFKSEIKSDIAHLEYRLMVKLGVLLSTIMTLGFTAVSLVIKFN